MNQQIEYNSARVIFKAHVEFKNTRQMLCFIKLRLQGSIQNYCPRASEVWTALSLGQTQRHV